MLITQDWKAACELYDAKDLLQVVAESGLIGEWDKGFKTSQEVKEELSQKCPERALDIKQVWDHMCVNQTIMYETNHLVKKLHDKGYRCFLFSNCGDFFDDVAWRLPAFQYFEKRLASYQYHLAKPSPEYYKVLFDVCNIDPSESLFIDDNPANIAAGKDLGMDGVIFKNYNQLALDLRARAFLDI